MKRIMALLGLAAVLVAVVTSAAYSSTQRPAHRLTAVKHSEVALRLTRPALGVDVEADTYYSVAAARADGRKLTSYIRNDLYAQSLGIVWDFCDPSFTSNIVSRCQQTLSSRAVRAIISEARQKGMTVQLRPIVRVGPPANWGNPHLSWEGFIRPEDPRAWFRSLLRTETPYLKLLRSYRGSRFVVGTEPFYTASSPYWSWLIAKAHRICHCSTSVASHIARYRVGVIPSRKAPGVDWYAHLHIPDSATQTTVTAALEQSMHMVPRRVLARTSLDEEGIRATARAYQHPEAWNIGGRNDPQVQARYFTAICQTAKHFRMRAVYFYEIPLNDDLGHPFSFPAYFVRNQGSKAIQGCARMFGALRGHG